MTGRLLEIHRYPVKSLGGERLAAARVDERGLAGDRAWAVYCADGKLASGKHSHRFRRMDPVFDLVARTDDGAGRPGFGRPGHWWARVGDAEGDALASAHFGEPVTVRPETHVAHQDAGQVSLVGTATLAALADLLGEAAPVDVRHFRANLVVETEEPWVEERWVGSGLRVGDVELAVVEPVERCRMVDVAQVGVAPHGWVLKTLATHRDLCLAVYADVRRPGTLRTGDEVRVSAG